MCKPVEVRAGGIAAGTDSCNAEDVGVKNAEKNTVGSWEFGRKMDCGIVAGYVYIGVGGFGGLLYGKSGCLVACGLAG